MSQANKSAGTSNALGLVARLAAVSLGVDLCWVALPRDGGALETAGYPSPPGDISALLSHLASTGEELVITNTGNAPLPEEIRDTVMGLGARSLLVVPVILAALPPGILVLAATGKHAGFKSREIALAKGFAELVASLKEYEEFQPRLAATRALAMMGLASSATAHRDRSLAAHVRALVTVLGDRVTSGDTGQSTLLPLIDALSSVASELAEKPPFMQPGQDTGQKTNINGLIRSRVEQYAGRTRYDPVRFSFVPGLESELSVHADPYFLQQALDILVDNAARALLGAPGDREPRVTLSTALEAGDVVIKVHDTGPGIPPALASRLFEQPIRGQEGLGMGLLIARLVVESYDGNIAVSETGPGGTTIRLSLPLAAE